MQTGMAAATGFLTASASPSVADTSLSTVDDLAEAPVEPGRVVYVRGRDEPNDGGGGFFLWDQTREPRTLDAGTKRARKALWVRSSRSDAGNWFRVWDGMTLDVRWFGARGDGTSNDGPAIQDTVFTAGYLDVKTTHLPAGTYRTERPIVIEWTSGQTLKGQSAEATRIVRAGEERYTTRRGEGDAHIHAAIVVPVGKTGTGGFTDSRRVTVKDLHLRQDELSLDEQVVDAEEARERYGIFVEGAYKCSFSNLDVDGFHTSFYAGKLYMSEIHNVRTRACVDFIHIAGANDRPYSAASTSLQISNCYCSKTVLGDGFVLSNVFYSSIQNCGADLVQGWPYRIRQCRGITLMGCGFEGTQNGKGFLFEGSIGVLSGCKSINPHANTSINRRVSTLEVRSLGGIESDITVIGSHFNDLIGTSGADRGHKRLGPAQVDQERNAGLLVDDRSRVTLIGSRIAQNAESSRSITDGGRRKVTRLRSDEAAPSSGDRLSIPEMNRIRDTASLEAINQNFERLRRTLEQLASQMGS